MQISFGKKIPFAKVKIMDRYTGKSKDATIYELDCKNKSDIDYMYRSRSCVEYKRYVMEYMTAKYSKLKGNAGISKKETESLPRFYVLEVENSKMSALCQTKRIKAGEDITFIETDRNEEHKYVGQALLAAISKNVIRHSRNKLYVTYPTPWSLDFYKKKCGFENNPSGAGVKLEREDMKRFVQEVERKTQGKIELLV